MKIKKKIQMRKDKIKSKLILYKYLKTGHSLPMTCVSYFLFLIIFIFSKRPKCSLVLLIITKKDDH